MHSTITLFLTSRKTGSFHSFMAWKHSSGVSGLNLDAFFYMSFPTFQCSVTSFWTRALFLLRLFAFAKVLISSFTSVYSILQKGQLRSHRALPHSSKRNSENPKYSKACHPVVSLSFFPWRSSRLHCCSRIPNETEARDPNKTRCRIVCSSGWRKIDAPWQQHPKIIIVKSGDWHCWNCDDHPFGKRYESCKGI